VGVSPSFPQPIIAVAVNNSDLQAATHTSDAQKRELQTKKDKVQDFYRAQSYQDLGREADQVQVPIWVDPDLDHEWKKWVEQGIKDINAAGPGLHLFVTSNKESAKVWINRGVGDRAHRASTRSNIIASSRAIIHLGVEWPSKLKKRTSTHEILHSLGFKHEHQRSDAEKSIEPHSSSNQVQSSKVTLGLSRFDPFSIMLYCECDKHFSRIDQDPIWKLKPDLSMNMEMSELDKLGLNLLYRPCKGPHYKPVRSQTTNMLYCARPVMAPHNRPARSTTDGRCGPNNWANCPACRTINTRKVEEIWKNGKWQGWSGVVYCGRYFGVQESGHDGYCGPNNGTPCPECKKFLLK
jgi:hypothetical protein